MISQILAIRRYLRDVTAWSAENPKRHDPATIKTDPDFWEKYNEWWHYYD